MTKYEVSSFRVVHYYFKALRKKPHHNWGAFYIA